MAQGLVWIEGSFFMSSSDKLTLFWRVAVHNDITEPSSTGLVPEKSAGFL